MINTSKLRLTILQQEILRLLFMNTGKSLNQRRIAQLLEVSQPAVTKAIPTLEKREFVIVNQDKESKRWAIELNTSNPKVIQLKRADNLKLVYEVGLSEFLEQECAGATIILFGSYSTGEDRVNSDIDIAVIGRKEKKIELGKFEVIFNKKINLQFYDSWKNIHNTFCLSYNFSLDRICK